jgi:hypothetical protein
MSILIDIAAIAGSSALAAYFTANLVYVLHQTWKG